MEEVEGGEEGGDRAEKRDLENFLSQRWDVRKHSHDGKLWAKYVSERTLDQRLFFFSV